MTTLPGNEEDEQFAASNNELHMGEQLSQTNLFRTSIKAEGR